MTPSLDSQPPAPTASRPIRATNSSYPGALEVCDLDDDNCDGVWDNDPKCPQCVVKKLPAPAMGNAAFCFGARDFAAAELVRITKRDFGYRQGGDVKEGKRLQKAYKAIL